MGGTILCSSQHFTIEVTYHHFNQISKKDTVQLNGKQTCPTYIKYAHKHVGYVQCVGIKHFLKSVNVFLYLTAKL